MSDAMAIDISCASYAAPVFLPYQPEARSGTWRIRQQLPLTQEWLRKCRRRSSSRSSACRQARDEQGWTAFALCWGEVRGHEGASWVSVNTWDHTGMRLSRTTLYSPSRTV